MNVDLLRFIDRWIGIPACMLLTIWMTLWKGFRACLKFVFRRNTELNYKNTLFIELSEMGSAIIVDPAMRKLQQQGAELFFVIFKENVGSLALIQTIPKDNIYTIRVNSVGLFITDTLRFIVWCRAKRITTVIDLELFSRFTAILSTLSLASTRIGFATLHDEGCYRGDLMTHTVRYNPHVHVAINFLSLVNTALGHNPSAYATYQVNPQELTLAQVEVTDIALRNVKEKIKNLYPTYEGQPIFLINPNASELLPQRRWLPERFAKIIKRLLADNPTALIIITGAPSERKSTERIQTMVGDERCINSAGYFRFNELVPLYQLATFMLTNDSGPAHFSAVVSLKVFVIFGPETPALYAPLNPNAESIYLGLPCSPCVSAMNHRKTSCTTQECISGISVDQVYDRIQHYLNVQSN